jgi:hypothetical protein
MILANTGTQVMMMQVSHLLFGNAVIGVIEALLLIYIFKARAVFAVPLMVLANYASTWLGWLLIFNLGLLFDLVLPFAGPNIENYQWWIALLIVSCFFVTVLIEAPFVWVTLRPGERGWQRWLKVNLGTQALTYSICIVPAYGLYGRVQITETASVEPVTSFVAKELPFWIYYIDSNDGDVYRIRPDGSEREHAFATGFTSARSFLFCFADDKARPRRDLWAYTDERGQAFEVLMTDFAAPRSEFLNRDGMPYGNPPWHLGRFQAAEFRSPSAREWTVTDRDNFGIEAMRASGEIDRLTFTTGFGTWPGRNPSILPGEIAIFALGDQICAWDLNQRKLGLIARGRGPVVVPDEDLSPAPGP